MLDQINNVEYKTGDVLFSKENNCKVTVEAVTTDGQIVCVWMDNDGHMHRELFSSNELGIIQPGA